MFGRGNSNWKVKSCAKSFLVFSFEGKKVVNKGSPSLFQFSLLLSHTWKQLLFITFTEENEMSATIESRLSSQTCERKIEHNSEWKVDSGSFQCKKRQASKNLEGWCFIFSSSSVIFNRQNRWTWKYRNEKKWKSPTAKIFGDERLVLWLATVQSNYKCCWSFCRLTFLIQTA